MTLLFADTQDNANSAASAVKVTYSEQKPPILTIKDAIAQKSFFPTPCEDLKQGDAEG